jgi:O-antigen ligase
VHDLPQTGGGSSRTLSALHGFLVGALLFGDYLTLSVSRALTGSSGNWIAFAAVLQPVIVVLTLLVGQVRQRLPLLLLSGYLGLCAIGFGHGAWSWLHGIETGEYAQQKLAALFFLLGPALCCGVLLGTRRDIAGSTSMPWLMAPLVGMCLLALAQNPRLLTIEYYADPPVFFGVLVMPAHQPLAFSLTKAALLCFALDQLTTTSRWTRALRLGFVGAMLGLVLLTGARSYAVALVAALAAQSLLSGRRLGLLLIGTAVALAVFQAYASDLVQERFDPTQALESLAYKEREQAWQAAWIAFGSSPLTGVGPGCFAQAGGWHGRVYPHNLPLEIAAEFGIVGLLCLVAMLAGPVWLACGLLRRRERPSQAGLFALGLLVFGFGGALAVGDLIRNYFLMFALGMSATALRPAAATDEAATWDERATSDGELHVAGSGG